MPRINIKLRYGASVEVVKAAQMYARIAHSELKQGNTHKAAGIYPRLILREA
jgi:hypothetical protein